MTADHDPLPDAAAVAARLKRWRLSRNYVAIGNLGEHVTGRLLVALGYQLLGAQDDFLGMVPAVLGFPSTAKPEDFVAADPDGRLLTVNSKASVSPRSCTVTTTGDLSRPHIARGQRAVDYTTLRASLISPLDGDAYSQVMKVDLVNMKAQVFDVGDAGQLQPVGPPHDIGDSVAAVLACWRDMPRCCRKSACTGRVPTRRLIR
ncbi:hypothetical protein ASD37_11690 [Mycobacterium sp. Root135]|uniref:hypothetical protein n=1 Tax=Mycobacterium sp. Root135 TaxID=1736457 RepID=UPI0006F684C6|nr:hypothetical protein [Mycobacterium sp. Root135]KQY06809.1 hypothetical protein ASD37_11690 [Mycobacterium sp. Root135]